MEQVLKQTILNSNQKWSEMHKSLESSFTSFWFCKTTFLRKTGPSSHNLFLHASPQVPHFVEWHLNLPLPPPPPSNPSNEIFNFGAHIFHHFAAQFLVEYFPTCTWSHKFCFVKSAEKCLALKPTKYLLHLECH